MWEDLGVGARFLHQCDYVPVGVLQGVEAFVEVGGAARVAVAQDQVVDVSGSPDVLRVGGVVDLLFEHLPRGRVVEVPRLGRVGRRDAATEAVVG